jgi:LacI family transcriptional regulator
VAALLKPPLTTITQPAYSIGKHAAQLLFSAINQGVLLSSDDSLEVGSELVVRQSA